MKTVIISASFLLTAFSVQAAETPYVAQSTRALASGLWSKSVAFSTKALATPGLTSDDTLKALTALCISRTKLGQFTEAWGACDKAVETAPAEWTAYINRGNLRAMLGYISAARADYTRAQSLNPTHQVVQAAIESKYSGSMITAPFVGIGAPGTVAAAKAGGAGASLTAQ